MKSKEKKAAKIEKKANNNGKRWLYKLKKKQGDTEYQKAYGILYSKTTKPEL